MGVWSFQIAFDCDDPTALCEFWHRALTYGPGHWLDDHKEFLTLHPEILGRQGVCQHPEAVHPRLYIQKVPEPKVGRNRIRLEISLPPQSFDDHLARLAELGATRVDDATMQDPAGNELIVVRGEGSEPRISAIEIDAVDLVAQSRFWSEVLRDAPATRPPHQSPALRFVQIDEPKARKNRLHLDLNLADTDDFRSQTRRVEQLGGRVLRPDENGNEAAEWGDHFHVMRDPEGNEFCLQATNRSQR